MARYLVEMTVYDPAIAGTRTLYFSTHDYTIKPTDTPPNQTYLPLLSQPGNYEETMFADGKTYGESKLGFGEVRISNPNGDLDALIDYGFDGRTIVYKTFSALGAILFLMSCSMEQPEFTNNEIVVRIKDPQTILNTPIQANTYAGSNVLPNGIEGTSDIQGKPKPLSFGRVFNVTPVMVNTSKLIYQVHESAADVPGAYDKGVALTRGGDYADQASMETTAPQPGEYRVCPSLGCFRLGSSAIGQVTADVVEGATATDRTAAQVAKRVASRVIPAGGISAEDITALDGANSSEVGIYISEVTTTMAVLDQVLAPGNWYGFDEQARLRMAQFVAPAGTPDVTLTGKDCISIDRVASSDPGRGISPYKVTLNYAKNYTVQAANDLAGSLPYVQAIWEPHDTLPGVLNWEKVTYGGGNFVSMSALNTPSIVATSSDGGVTWDPHPLPSYGNFSAHCYGDGVFVAVGLGFNRCMVSTDYGVTWVLKALPSSHDWASVAYGAGVFVAVAKDAAVAIVSSDKGLTWTQVALPSARHAIAFGGGSFIAVDYDDPQVAVSSDGGLTWALHPMLDAMPDTYTHWGDIAYSNGIFAVSAYLADFAVTSSDGGITWIKRSLPAKKAWTSLAAGNGIFVATAFGSNMTTVSIDGGVTWAQYVLPSFASWSSLAYGDGSFVGVATGGSSLSATYTIINRRTPWLSREFRTISAIDRDVLNKHLLAPELVIDTPMVNVDDAQDEADRLLELYKPRRDTLQVQVKTTVLANLAKGKLVMIKRPRYGYDDGKLFRCIGSVVDRQQGMLTLTLWG